MTSKGKADIVFCLDASGSMAPCFTALRNHIQDFIEGLTTGNQASWDLRLDYLAHSTDKGGNIYQFQSLHHENSIEVVNSLYRPSKNNTFFTDDIGKFKKRLKKVNVVGDETPLIALDTCLDFPWRVADECHRIVVLMTDESFETGAGTGFQKSRLDNLINKIMDLKVMLFIVAPESDVFDELSSADKCEYTAVDETGRGLSTVNFKELLSYIGKSVSKSNLQQTKPVSVERGLYGQAKWGSTNASISGS